MEKEYISFKCFKVHQPIGEFYIGLMDNKDLLKISYADIRRLETGSEFREVEVYTGIQRPLVKKRVKEIGEYVNMVDATFPTGIILHVNENNAEYDEEKGLMTLPYKKNVAKILDGQHRIAGLENFTSENTRFELNVTIFVGMDSEDQAIVFATINKTQTKVNKSLVADLFAFSKYRSPQKTAHNIVRALNQKEGSPFKGKIKILGTAIDIEKETITQATFTDQLIKYISKKPMKDRDVYKRGRKPKKYFGKELQIYPLRNLFIDEDDVKIAKIIWNYFEAVEAKWPLAWNRVEKERILNKSTGFIALMRFFKDIYISFGRIGEVIDSSQYLKIFENIELRDEDFTREKYIPGTSGQFKLYKDLIKFLNLFYEGSK